MKPENTLFVPGLWLNPKGQLATKISEDATVLDILGFPNIGSRVLKLVDYLEEHPEVTNLVGHSAGCYTIATAIKMGLCRSVKKIVMLNPSPMPGIKFSPKDLVFWLLSKPTYLWGMITGKNIKLSRGDTKKLLSLTDEQVNELIKGNSLVPDSGVFVRHIVMNQFKKPWDKIVPQNDTALTVVSAFKDKMVGSTWEKTEKIFSSTSIIHMTDDGHMTALYEFKDIVGHILER